MEAFESKYNNWIKLVQPHLGTLEEVLVHCGPNLGGGFHRPRASHAVFGVFLGRRVQVRLVHLISGGFRGLAVVVHYDEFESKL